MKEGPALETQDAELKRIALLGLVGVIFAATLTVGANAAYLLIALSAVGAAIYYHNDLQSWFSAHQTVWIGATAGFFFGGATFGPIGMALGAWLGHFAGQTVNNARKVVNTVTAPITYAKDTTHSAWNAVQSGVGKAYQYITTQPDETVSTTPLPIQKAASIPTAIPSKQPKIVKETKAVIKQTAPIQKLIHRKPMPKSILKKPTAAAPTTGWQIWQTFTGLFTQQPTAKKPEEPIAQKSPKKLTWHQDIAKKHNKVANTEVSKAPAKQKSDPWFKPILTIM